MSAEPRHRVSLAFRIRLAATFAVAAVGTASIGAAVEVTALEPHGGLGVERGVVLIRCTAGGSNLWRISRGALLDLDLSGADRDVVLATAHGLSGGLDVLQRDCRVLGAHGLAYRIQAAWRAPSYETGGTGDWAVLLIKRRLEGNVGRLRAVQVTTEGMLRLAGEAAPVRLVLRNADERQGDCNLRPLASAAREPGLAGLMFYSCRGVPGLSGSPILTGVDGRPLLIGIHLGWGLVGDDSEGARSVNVGHVIDTDIVVAIAAAVAGARN